MKRLFLFLSGFLAFMIFFSDYQSFSNKDYIAQTNYIVDLAETNNETAYLYSIDKTYDNDKNLVNELYEFAVEHDYTLSIGNSVGDKDSDKKLFKDFMYTSRTNPIVYTKHNKEFDFKEKGKYLTTDLNDKNAYDYIEIFDSKPLIVENSIIEIHPLLDYDHVNSKIYLSFVILTDDKNKLDEDIRNSSFYHKLEQGSGSEGGVFPLSYFDRDTLLEKLIVSVLIGMLIVYISMISKSKKEICIRKLNGTRDSTIVRKMFLKPCVLSVISFVLVMVVCFFMFCGGYKPLFDEFIQDLSSLTLLFVCLNIVVYIISYVFVRSMKSVTLIKKTEINNKIVLLNLTLKVVVLAVLLQPFMGVAYETKESLTDLHRMIQYEDMMRSTASIHSSIALKGDSWEVNQKDVEAKNKVFKYMNEKHAIYMDFMNVYMLDIDEDPYYTEKYIIVNKEYMKQYSVYDTSGKKINTDAFKQNMLLVPSGMLIDEDKYCKGECEVIEVQKGNAYVELSPRSDLNTVKDPIVLVLYEPSDYDASLYYPNLQLPLNDKLTKEDVKKDLEELGILDYLILENTEAIYDTEFFKIKNKLMSAGMMLIVYLSVILIFIYQNIYINYMENKKLLSIQYLLGTSFIRRYFILYVITVLSYVFALGLLFIYSRNLGFDILVFTFVLMICDVMLQTLIIKYFEKKSSVILKGQ